MCLTSPRKGLRHAASMLVLVLTAVTGNLLTPLNADAHRPWLKPSAAQVEGKAPWVTIDAAISEGIFDFDHQPLKLDGLSIIGPDGQAVTPEAPWTGKVRSAFDLQLNQTGTYRITVASAGVMGSYTLNGETKRFRGTEADYQAQIPTGASDVKLSRNFTRLDTFVSSGKPNTKALQPTGQGLEMVAVTHPSELVAGEPATLKFLLDGQPIADLGVTIIPDGGRFRNALKEVMLTTNAAGEVTVTWAQAGYQLVTASYPPRPKAVEGGPPPEQPAKRFAYSATFEVLPN